jgi:hypothetical protein
VKPFLSALLLGIAVVGCTGKDQSINRKLSALVADRTESTIELTRAESGEWDRVCFLAPYRTNESTESILGFKWNSDLKSSIGGNDGIYALVFIRNNKVVAFTEHPRSHGDFVNIHTGCLKRSESTLRREIGADGRLYLVR